MIMIPQIIKRFSKDIHAVPNGIKLIVFMIFLRTLGWGFVDPFYSFYLLQFATDYTVIGSLVSLASLSALLTIIPLMRLTDKVKETTLISDGQLLYLLVIISFVFAGIFKSVPLLLISLIFAGIAQTFIVVGSEAYIRKHNRSGKTGPFALYLALDYFGWILGMVIASWLIVYYDFNSMFLFVIPSVIASFFILPRIRERGLRSFFSGIKRYFHTKNDLVSIVTDVKSLNPKVIFFLILAFFDGMIRMFSFIFIPLFALKINLSLPQIALMMAAMYFPFSLSFFFSEFSVKMKRMSVIAFGLFTGAVSFILLYFIVDKLWFVFFAASISLSLAIIRPAYNGAITRLAPRGMLGEITGLNNLVERIGRVIGPILIGLVADRYGLPITFLMIAFIAIFLGVLSLMHRQYDYLTTETESILS